MTEKYDFDLEIDRGNTQSVKWERYRGTDIIPLWVADSDFAVAPAIQQALLERVKHPVFGYTEASDHLVELLIKRMQHLYDWKVEASWIFFLPGVVNAMNCAVRSIGEAGDSVFTPSVVYPPISEAPENGARINQPIPMIDVDGRQIIDLDWLQQNPGKPGQLLILCNPQNPGGAMYSESEMQRLAQIAEEQDLVLCADEIHCELVLDSEKKHIPVGSISPAIEQRSITLMAPSKTFNLAGLGFSFAIVPNRELRLGMLRARKGIVPYNGVMGYTAAMAAYESADEWNRQQCEYLAGNRDYLLGEINAIAGLHLGPVEATYLAWINVADLQLPDPPKFFEAAGVGMSPGRDFGDSDWMRLNFACPRSRLVEAVERIRKAVGSLS